MKIKKQSILLCLLIMLLCAALLLCGCGKQEKEEKTPEITVIEKGQTDETTEEETGETETTSEESGEYQPPEDKGEKTELEDLIAAQQKIRSFYFDQTVSYSDGQVFNQVWYRNNKMKLVSSVSGQVMSEYYYDYEAGTLTTYYVGSTTAVRYDFDFTSADAPNNPVREDYSAYSAIGGEYINGQYCLLLETQNGDYLWISTASGFPLRAEYTDSLGERMTVSYDNVAIGEVSESDVELPEGVTVR